MQSTQTHPTQAMVEKIIQHPSPKVKIAVTDLDGILRGKVVHKDKFFSLLEKGFGFCDVIFGWDLADQLYENSSSKAITGWHTGFPDAEAKIAPETFREVPWDQDTPFFLADFHSSTTASKVCPRSLLRRIRQKAIDMGFSPMFSQEFEWFNFSETPESLREKRYQHLQPMTPGMFGYSILRSSYKNAFFNQLYDEMTLFKVPLEGLHTETGPGVYEAAIQVNDILEAADRAVLFKTGVKEIAYQHELIASFMARWNNELPGCSGHVHQSLWDIDGQRNLFYEEEDPLHMSSIAKHYLAGLIYCFGDILPLCAPTTNSYQRLVEGYWAPTKLNWGIDNRTTAFRVLPHGEKSCRIESRIPGSDTNPYLAMSACLAAGLYGIENKIPLEDSLTTGNGYEGQGKKLPTSLEQATELFQNSMIAKDLLGEDFVAHYAMTRAWEVSQQNPQDTLWELKRYFEII
ncbi:glutamine synthetase family protein [Algivirga pacifica]|uniref:Glutamine synthetase n=1 Tax=Algivirga pacifica TaxID=1162670 RepID=A0ABP9DA57_9BACT